MARNGKIARLPLALREQANHRLLDGESNRAVIAWLNALPEVQRVLADQFGGQPINDQNMSDWRRGGYAEWSDRRQRLEHTRELAQFSMKLAEASGGTLADGTAAILAGHILEVVEKLTALGDQLRDAATPDKDQLANMAEALDALTTATSKLRRGDHDAEALRQGREKLEHLRQTLDLERQKFQRTTCALFLQWYNKQDARDILDADASNDEKTERLGKLIFGEDWK
jgi:hypothetical protein